MSTQYFMMIEPEYAGTHWCEQCVQGIRQEAARGKGVVEEIPAGDAAALRRIAASERPLMILVGSLVNWMTDAARALNALGIHGVMTASAPPDAHLEASAISLDYHQAIFDLFWYLEQMGRARVALFGVHPNSINDLTKRQAYVDYLRDKQDRPSAIFENLGDLSRACQQLYQRIDEFDAVICSNDIIALKLQGDLKARGVPVPEKLRLASIGETRLSQLTRPRIITAALNFQDIGHNAVRLYNILRRNPAITSLQVKMRGAVTGGEQLGPPPHVLPAASGPAAPPEQRSFYADADVERIFRLENLIAHCLPIDFAILRGLARGDSYRLMAETHYTSENAVKYRVKRMLELAQCDRKETLLSLILSQLQMENIPEA